MLSAFLYIYVLTLPFLFIHIKSSMRTIQSSIYYPQAFFAYFTLFHIYYFSCPFGFSYSALMSTALFQLHSMIFFWNRYELPAILSGEISSERPRMRPNQRNGQNVIMSQAVGDAIAAQQQYVHGGEAVNSSMVAGGQEIQRLRSSYPSMSSLGGRISSFDGYWMSIDGEVSLFEQCCYYTCKLMFSCDQNHYLLLISSNFHLSSFHSRSS